MKYFLKFWLLINPQTLNRNDIDKIPIVVMARFILLPYFIYYYLRYKPYKEEEKIKKVG